ncbi:LOW QUALITY PROTEIN: CLIP domain-containing serine protease B4 [Galleria mellonella]|uniref:LOW QUALITY PROTEIN: CLIP domain-containing serine protease B4 n=1 Tax=Galleria mellonella TaxID=7137 RepID=A0ABM3MG25_GALME|nr:LOW QUALITY PROTEIN: CLIP domain-containing serine protease B4 [Galleria mellonella]
MSLFVFICLCIIEWTVDAQFGSMSLSLGLGDRNNNEDLDNDKGPCPPNTQCKPISSCPMLEDLLDFSCFSSDKYFHRLNELTCGHANSEDYVCCPSCDCSRVYQEGTERCGQSMVRAVNYSGIGAHPWVARIGFTHKESGNVRFAPEGYKLSTVVVGEYDASRSPDCSEFFCAPPTQAIKVENVIVHPGYEKKIFRHDIALVVLKEEIRYSVTAAPVCLNDRTEIVINERATLVGWGKLSGQSSMVSRQQLLDVPLVTLETCERIFGDSVPVHEGQLCAGGEEGRDACAGFGGAPLLLNRDGQYFQVGIVSFGSEKCGSDGVPSVYTNVAHYHRWIVENSPS